MGGKDRSRIIRRVAMACQAKGREVRIIHYHVGQYRLVLVVIVAGFLYTSHFASTVNQPHTAAGAITANRARKPPRFIRGMKRRSFMERGGGACAELFDRADIVC